MSTKEISLIQITVQAHKTNKFVRMLHLLASVDDDIRLFENIMLIRIILKQYIQLVV